MPRVVRGYKDQARARIVDAAVAVFRRKGLGAATMEQIAHELGVSKGALYLYFPTKTHLLREVQGRFRDEMLKNLENSTATGDVAEAIASVIDDVISGQRDPGVLHQLLLEASNDSELRAAIKDDQRADIRHMRVFLKGLQARGRIPPMRDATATAEATMMVLAGAVLGVVMWGDRSAVRRRLVRTLRVVLGLAPPT